MNRPTQLLLVALALAGPAARADDDPVEKALTAARRAFEQANEKARAGLLADLKHKAEAAQRAGDLKALEKAQAETKAFETAGALPAVVPVAAYQSQLRAARDRMEEGYATAVKQYTRNGNIAQAKAVQKDLDEFQKAGPPKPAAPPKPDGRRRWVHAGGEFVEVKDGVWEEKSPGGNKYRFKEVGRTKEYVEIDALNGDTSLRYRL